MILLFRIRGFFFPNIFLLFFFAANLDGDIVVNRFQSNLFYILYDIRLSSTFLWTFFFQCGLLCMFLVDFFFSQPDVNITWITGHIHRSIVDKIDPTSEYVEMVKQKYTLSITLGYIFLWNVIRRIYLTVRNTFDEPWRGSPFFLISKLEEWLIMKFVLENCLLDLFVVLDLDLGSILIDNSFFCLSKIGFKYYLYFICFWQ